VTPPIGLRKEMVSADGIVVGTMCGRFSNDDSWNVGMTAEEYHRQLDEALERENETATGGTMATLTRKEWDLIRRRRSEADVKYVFALLQRDGEITIENDENKKEDA
jgi:hypothetical protein